MFRRNPIFLLGTKFVSLIQFLSYTISIIDAMVSNHLSDMLSKLSLDSENEDRLTFCLSILRRKGKTSCFISKTAVFILDIDAKKWIYLELKKIGNHF